ncbi:MAG: hypothetical protein ACRC0V_08480 [Fusobacteriaceae bacterium]
MEIELAKRYSSISQIIDDIDKIAAKEIKSITEDKQVRQIQTLLDNVKKLIKEKCVPCDVSITWSVEDFIDMAIQKEGKSWESIYDKSLFEEEILEMFHNYDCQFGITWDTVEDYLEKCKYIKDEYS